MLRLRLCASVVTLFLPALSLRLMAEELSLPSAIDRALGGNFDLLVERENIQINRDQVLRELGDFRWRLEARIDEHRSWEPLNQREQIAVGDFFIPLNQVRIYHEHRQTAQAAFKRRMLWGTEFALQMNASRLVNTTNEKQTPGTNGLPPWSPEWEAFLGVALSQPLLQGFGPDATHAEVELARMKVDAAVLLTRVKAMNLVAETASRYVDVLAADETLALRKDSVRRAEELVERNRRRQDAGVGVEIDVTTAQLAVSQRENELIDTAAEKVERLNTLLALIGADPDEVDAPTLRGVEAIFAGVTDGDLEALRRAARSARMDILYYQRVVDSAELNARRVRDATRPKLDLTASYGLNALTGDPDDWDDVMEERQGEEWSVGLLLKMDLEPGALRAARRVADRQLFQARMELAKAVRAVGFEIDTAASRVRSAEQRLATAEQAGALAAKRLEQEMQSLEQGKADLYRVVEQQQILADAEAEVVATRAFLRKARLALWMATGQVFDRLGVEPEQVAALVDEAPSGIEKGGRP